MGKNGDSSHGAVAHTGFHENTSPERSSAVNEGPNAPFTIAPLPATMLS
jgi:hypothetical protein